MKSQTALLLAVVMTAVVNWTSYALRREENRSFSALFKSNCFTLLGWERELNLIEEIVRIFG